MRMKLLPLALVLCLLSTGIDIANAQPPYRRKLLTSLPALPDQLALRQLIMNYLTPPVINLHLTPGIHPLSEYFLSWHRGYIEGLEAWLMTQPGGSAYVPLPKYDPFTPIPNAFFNSNAPGSAIAAYPPGNTLLVNQNPLIDLSGLMTNPCQWTADGFGAAVTGPHNTVHTTINGSMGATNTASATAIFWPWHAFLDDMYRYYQCNCQNIDGKDLYMKDDVKDIGDEPNTTAPQGVYNGSPDIWVRNALDSYDATTQKYSLEDDPTHHQNPVTGVKNYVYVRVRNRGCLPVDDDEMEVRIYWSCFSTTNGSYPADWTYIGSQSIPSLDPGRQYVAEIGWDVPKDRCDRFCILARLVPKNDPSVDPIGPEVANVLTNVRNYNNVAVRNVDVVPADPYNCTPTGPCNKVRISRAYDGAESEYGYDRIRFDYTYNEEYRRNPVYVEVDLGEGLYNAWVDGGSRGYGIEDGDQDDYKVRITEPGAYLDDVYLEAGETYEPCVRAYVQNPEDGGYGGYGGYDGYSGDAGYPGYGGYGKGKGGSYGGYGTYGGVYPIHVSQYESYEGNDYEIVGGATYEVRAERDYEAVPDAEYIQDYTVTPASCPEVYDGSIQLEMYQDPAAGEYTYWWSNGANTRDIYDLKPGTYSVVVRDNNDCAIDTREYEVGSYSTLGVYTDGDLPHCEYSDGAVRSNAYGGTEPYTYQWYRDDDLLPNETGSSIYDTPQGRYMVTVTDAGGCSVNGYVELRSEWDMLSVEVSYTEASGPDEPDGAAYAIASGMPDLVYAWSNGATTERVEGLVPGDYWVDVTDMSGDGCTKRRYFTIGYTQEQLNGVDRGNTAVSGVMLVPNPTSSTTELRYYQQRPGMVQIELYDNLGRRVDLLYSGHLRSGDQTLPIATESLASGQYVVRIVTGGVTTTVPLTIVH